MYTLDDVEEIARQHPETFDVPSVEMRQRLQPGDLIKVHFRGVDSDGEEVVERMWVEISEVETSGYVGRLDNEPIRLVDVKCDETVKVLPINISSIWIDELENWDERLKQVPHKFD
jgi:uncharacterized protein YegJ (DUF2314 family)